MRVIAGKVRGHKLLSLEGHTTRPTTDKIKESVFNIIQFTISGKVVLDLFAGSGAFGIEALSRGAGSAVFVDKSGEACSIIEQNIAKTKMSEFSLVLHRDSFEYLKSTAGKKFDIIFLDPPYGTDLLTKALAIIAQKDALSVDGIAVCECDRNDNIIIPSYFEIIKDVNYGRTNIKVIKKAEEMEVC